MWPESAEDKRPLRTGLTTGTCATAACVAAAHKLLGNRVCQQVSVTLPDKHKTQGKVVELTMQDVDWLPVAKMGVAEGLPSLPRGTTAATIKDAGDDPDVTHGARIWVKLLPRQAQGVIFTAGEGVGQVTREGLQVAVGEAAINPVPRQMMQLHLQRIAQGLCLSRWL